jgi:hypothetical protein
VCVDHPGCTLKIYIVDGDCALVKRVSVAQVRAKVGRISSHNNSAKMVRCFDSVCQVKAFQLEY